MFTVTDEWYIGHGEGLIHEESCIWVYGLWTRKIWWEQGDAHSCCLQVLDLKAFFRHHDD